MDENMNDFIKQNKENIVKIVEEIMAEKAKVEPVVEAEEHICKCNTEYTDKIADLEKQIKTLTDENISLTKQVSDLRTENETIKTSFNTVSAQNVFIPNALFAKIMNSIIVAENAGTIDNLSTDIINAVKETNTDIKKNIPKNKFRVKRIPVSGPIIPRKTFDEIMEDIFSEPFMRFF